MSGRSRQDSPSPPPPSDHQTDQQLSINPRAVAAEQARSKSNLKKSGANLSGSSEGSSKRVLLSETVSVSNSALDNQTHHRHLAAMGSSSSQKNLPTSTKSSSDINKVASKSNLERNPSKLGGGSWTTTADQEPNVGSEDQLISKSLNGLPIATATTVAAAPRNRSPPKNRGMTAESYTSGGRALTPLSKPQRLWAELRLQVRKGFFHTVLHQRAEVTSDFLATVDRLWKDVHKYSDSTPGQKDSTTDFVMSGWAKIKAAKHEVTLTSNLKRPVTNSSVSDQETTRPESSSRNRVGTATQSSSKHAADDDGGGGAGGSGTAAAERQGLSFLAQGNSGIDRLSLDSVPNADIDKDLRKISDGLTKQIVDVVDFWTIQVNLNRAWKLLVLGLRQTESFARHMAMYALRGSIPVINETLLDSSTRESLVRSLLNLMLSDERSENRLRAVYLLGQVAQALGTVREHDGLLRKAFNEVAKKILEIQGDEKKQIPKKFEQSRDLKIYLFQALGKFAVVLHERHQPVEDLVLYMVHSEFTKGDSSMPIDYLVTAKSKATQPPTLRGHEKTPGSIFVVRSLLSILNNMFQKTDVNSSYIGILFKPFVHPLMRSENAQLQMMAVQFISKWLPITHEDAQLLGNEGLVDGLKQMKSLQVTNFSKDQFNKELEEFSKSRTVFDSKKTMRTRLIRQLLQMPGTWANLSPVDDHPGFFAESDSTMLHTKGIVVNLPIHPKSFVILTRVLPPIPGVPTGMTTVPPVFMDPNIAEKQAAPRTYYEAQERSGRVPGLGVGLTYSPTPLFDLKAKKAVATSTTSSSRTPELTKLSLISADTGSKSTTTVSAAKVLSGAEKQSGVTVLASSPFSSVQYTPDHLRIICKSMFDMNEDEGEGDLPDNTTRLIPKLETPSKKIPLGFLSMSPFPGFDPGKVDRNAIMNAISAIYNMRIHTKSREKNMGADSGDGMTKDPYNILYGPKDDPLVPTGFTIEKNPVLWPNKNVLKSVMQKHDFYEHAPVLFEIIQPGTNKLMRIMTKVRSVNKELSSITVEKENGDGELALAPGTTFNIFVRNRQNGSEWISINLEVVDDDFKDDLINPNAKSSAEKASQQKDGKSSDSKSVKDHETEVRKKAKAITAFDASNNVSVTPLPVGYSTGSDPYFAPPVNLPPLPVGYTELGAPFFDKTPSIKPLPAGVSLMGTRFYNKTSKIPSDAGVRNQIAGYDYNGFPFFLPRGCSIPSPAGFTVDGIPYYDIPTIMQQRGILLLQTSTPTTEWSSDYIGNATLASQSIENNRAMTMNLVQSLSTTQSLRRRTFIQRRKNLIGKIKRVPEFEKLRELLEKTEEDFSQAFSWNVPKDVVDFFREHEDLTNFRPTPMKLSIEPSSIEFQGVKTPVSKNVLFKWRSARGDHQERDFFVAIEPVDVFSVKIFHLKLQAEGVIEVLITYFPNAMKSDSVHGMLCLIDEFGKKLATCNLFALRQSFIKVTPLSIDAGWILPEKRKECVLRLENGTRGIISLKIGLRSDVKEEGSPVLLPASSFTSDSSALSRQKPSAFTIPTKNLTLQSLENRFVTFLFEPSCLGPFSDVLEVRAPGGDIIEVQVHGTAGIPIALYPEDEESSKVGAASLTKERCEFMKKFKRVESTEKAHVALNTKDMSILQSMMLATSDQDSRREAHTLEYYLCSIEEKSKTRCLTLMNLSDQPLTVGLYSHSPCVKCPYLIRIAPRMAHSVEITLEITEASQLKNGKFSTVVEIVCPDFQNIELHVRGFVGQPLYIPCWDIAYFKPCVRGVTEELEMCLINESHFDLSFIVEMENKEDYNDMSANSISCSLSSDPDKPTMISADSTRPIVFSFSARERGPFLQTVFFKVLKPFSATIPAALLSKPLRLAGICIEPYLHKPGEVPDKNGIDFIRTWISHPKRVIDEYPAFDEKSKRFDTTPTSKPSTGVRRDIQSEVQFKKEMILFRANQRSKNNSFMDSRRSSSQTVQLQHRGKETVQCLFFGSTYLNADPRAQKVNVGDDLNIEIVSLPPPDFPDYLTTFGFAIALQEHDHKFHAIQVISKYSTDFLLYPSPNSEGSIILDFGNVEFSSVDTELTTKSIVLCNTFPVSYSWTAKIVSSKNKYSAFELGVQSGELLPFDSITLPFKLRCENSGTFESSAEIQIKESTEKGNKTTKIADVILKAQTVNTSLTGFPENIEFGSVLATHKRRRKFVLTNNGSTEAMVTILVKPPFYAEPKTIKLLPKEQYPVEVIYQPTESKTSIGKMLVFTNHKLYSVQLSGTGGTAELICEKYDKKEVDYGEQREGTIAWTSIYLTNKGTFPIALRGVSASSPDLVKLYYLDCTNSVPYEVATPNTLESLNVRRDYWSAVRRKVKIFSILRLLQRSVSLKSYISSARRTGGFKAEDGQPIRVFKKATTNFSENSMQTAVPPLKPFFSYHFRLGYSSRYQLKTKTDLIFHYLPLTSDDELSNIQSMVTAMSLNVTGYPYRPLEFFPPSFDFGIWPAEDFIEMQGASAYRSSSNNSYGMAKNEGIENSQQQGLYIQILNMSLEVQNFTLQSIPPEFLINGRTWNVLAGEKLLLPVEFHPPKEQVQYRGEAKFIHKHGTASISLAGTGASAEVFAEDTLDFGSIKFGSVSSLPLKIINRGLLASKFTLEIIQDGENLRFENDDPYEYEGVIESGSTLEMNIKCECKTVLETTPIVAVRWARVPGGQIEQIIVPIHVKIGIPHFKLKVQEVDFRTTYIKVNRTVEVKVLNDGNANCSWTAVSESPVLHLITPTSGIIEPGQSTTLRIQFAPIDYDILQSSISFVTDAGRRLLMCYGSVGVPYLQIPQDMLITDFDIVEINRTHIKPFNITNSGKKSIEYDIVITDLKQDGIDIPSSMFDVFTVEPSHHVVGPGETFSAQLKCVPKDYNAIYTAQILASTRDGEEYSGKVSAVGGKAIIKLAPPSVGITDNAVTAEVSASLPSSSEGRGNNGMTKNSHLFEAAKITYALHLENLQEVIAGLRAAELDGHLDQMEIQKLKDASTLGLNSDPEAMDAASTASMTGFPRSRGKPKPTIFDGSDLKQNIQEGLNQTDDSEEQDGSMQNRSRAILASRSARSREGGDGISMSLFYTDQLEKMEIGIENMISSASNHSFENKQQQKRGVATPDSSKNAFGRYLPGTPRGRSKLQSPSKETASTSSAGSSSVNNSFGWKAVSPDRHDRKFRPPSSLTARSAVAKQLVALTEPIQFMTDDIKLKISETEMEVNPVQQKSLISKVNDTILDHTQAVLFGLKEKLNSGWVPNREVLTTALRRLQVSNRMVEELLENEKNRDIKDESDFALGIFKSGEKSNTILLFNLPNTGNLSFDYELRLLQDSIVFPPSFDLKDSTKVELFKISPQTGTVSPKESVNISASFQGSVPGLYRQGYALVSSDEVISKFTVSVNVGEPKLVLNPMFVDFGMVMCGKSSTSTVSLSNIGTFKDNWLIKSDSKTLGNMPVVLVNEMSRKVPFGFDTIRGLLPQGADTPIQITFKPAELGNYEQTYQISWNQEPILFNVKGVGGASKIKPIFIDERDKIFVGLDFGRTCVVGLSYKRSFQLMNIGNVEGEFELIASHEAFSLDVTRDSNGKVRIMPNATLDVHVTFSPVKTVDLNENFQIRIPDKNPQSIPIKGYAGVCDWNVDGVVDFHNMPINSSQTRLITIANIGDLEFPVLLKLEPDTIDPFITIEYENVVGPDFVLSAGVSTTIKVTFDSENDQKVDGNITLKTNHGAEDKFIKYPFNFRVYEKQVAFDLQDDINIGRILVGESSSINRNLTNYGTKDVKYRSRVLPSTESGEIKPGESKFGTPWRLLTATDGTLLAGGSINVDTIYEAVEGNDDEWHNAVLLVETQSDSKQWTEIYRIKLKGGGGKPKLEMRPSFLDFSHMSITSAKVLPVIFASTGTAPVNFELPESWDNQDIFKLVTANLRSGRIDPGKELELQFEFSPNKEKRFSAIVKIKTQLEVKELIFGGEGARYHLNAASIPPAINLGRILFGDSCKTMLVFRSNCKFPTKVDIAGFIEDPSKVVGPVPEPKSLLDIQPSSVSCPALSGQGGSDASEGDSFEISISVNVPLPTDEDGALDEVKLRNLIDDQGKQLYIELLVEHGERYVVPMKYEYCIRPLILMQPGNHRSINGNEQFKESVLHKKVSFGEANMLEGSSLKSVIHNPNRFSVPYMIAFKNVKQFESNPEEGILDPLAFEEIILTFKAFNYIGDENVPKVLKYSGTMELESTIHVLRKGFAEIEGFLVDRPEPLIFDDLNYGGVMKKRKKVQVVSFKNPALRMMKWKLFVEPKMKDIFEVLDPASGNLRPRNEATAQIVFKPKNAVTYSAQATLETDERTYTFNLDGTGTEAQLALSANSIDYGVVGLSDPEVRTVTLENTTAAPIIVGVKSKSREFSISQDYYELKPGETETLEIVFRPSKHDTPVLSTIIFMDLDLVNPNDTPEEFGKVSVRGVGGEFGLSSGSFDAETGNPKVDLPFNRVNKGTRIKKTFELVNTGDTIIHLEVLDSNREICGPIPREMIAGTVGFKVEPSEAIIQARGSQKFNFVLRGIEEGEISFTPFFRTKRLQKPRLFPMNVTALVVSGFSALQESVKSFARADDSLEELLNYQAPYDKKYVTDADIWKVLLPVVRVSQFLPSMEYQFIPHVTPNTILPDIKSFTVRPPAIPKELPQRAKKWYMNRVSMALDEDLSKGTTESEVLELLRKQQALELVASVERKLFVEKTARRF